MTIGAGGWGPRWRARLGGRRPTGADSRVLAFAAIAMTMTVYGQTPGVAVFVAAVIADLGLDRAEVSAAYAVGSLASAFVLPWIGRQLDLVGVRTMTILIAAGFSLAMVVLAGAQGIIWLAVGFAGIRLFGQGALGLAGRNAVTLHFRVGLGRAVAISGSIAALVSSAVPFVLAAFIAGVGWRETWLGAAVSVCVVVIPATILLLPRRDPASVPAEAVAVGTVPAEAVAAEVVPATDVLAEAVAADVAPEGAAPVGAAPAGAGPADVLLGDGGDADSSSPGSLARSDPGASVGGAWTRARAIRSRMFWLITLANAAGAVILTGFAFHQISVLGEAGLSAEAAAAMFVPLTIASVGFLAIVAPLAGRWASRTILAGAMAPLIIAMVLVPLLGEPLVPVVYACALGAALGAGQVLDGILYPRHFGVHAIGAIRGAAFTVVATASAAGPVIVDVLRGLTGSYVVAALLLTTLPAVVVAAAFVLREPPAVED